MKFIFSFFITIFIFTNSTVAQDEPLSAKHYPQYPQTQISNDVMTVSIYLPDAEDGYYRGTRFDWSGVISRVQFAGHTFYGEWKEGHDPTNHDDIVGPVEEFSMEDPLGYEDAEPGEPFVKIGVGTLIRKNNQPYRFAGDYDIEKAGTWQIKQEENWIEFYQEFTGPTGWGYHYRKRIELAENQPVMTIHHWLKNTNVNAIQTTHYNHNFTIIDDQPIGEGYVVEFPFDIEATGDLKNRAEIEGNKLVFTAPNQPGSIFTGIEGFEPSVEANDILIKNENTQASIHIVGDQPPFKINLWTVRWTLCPEPFINIDLQMGQEMEWNYQYAFSGDTLVK